MKSPEVRMDRFYRQRHSATQLIALANPACSYKPIEASPTCLASDRAYIVVVASRHGVKGTNMQTAQINSPRFSYQAAAPTVPNTLRTLDDFRPMHGSYAGSFSGKSNQPIWIAVGMIAAVAAIAAGVNMYSASHTAKIETVAPRQSAFVEPATPAVAPAAIETPMAKQIVTSDSPAAVTKASEVPVPAKAAPVITKKAAPIRVEPAQMVAPLEVVPATPPMVEPVPAPLPIVIEKPITPAPAPAPTPEAPPTEPKA